MKSISLAFSLVISACAADYHLDLAPETTRISWTLGDVLHTVRGTFKLKHGDIHFDPETGSAGGEVVVDTTTGESGSGARDSRMHKNVLESARFPEASFAPDHMEGRVAMGGTSNIKLHGIFKIHGGAHEITVPVQVTGTGDQLSANLKFDVPYVAWGMKDPSTLFLKVNKSVLIEMQTSGRLSPAAISTR